MMTFEAFSAEHRAAGCDEVLERRWQPNIVIDTHTHPFAVQALVVQGEFWLTVGSRVQHLKAGDRFAVDADVPHAERYGAEGAIFWVARRNKAKASPSST